MSSEHHATDPKSLCTCKECQPTSKPKCYCGRYTSGEHPGHLVDTCPPDVVVSLNPYNERCTVNSELLSSEPHTMPMQVILGYNREGGAIAKPVYMAAYEVYSHVHGPQPAMVEGGCRGGFSSGEVIAFLYARAFPKSEWRLRSEEALLGMRGIK